MGIRQGFLQGFLTIPFILPLAIIGVPFQTFQIVNFWSNTYIFCLHTNLVSLNIPYFNLLFNTPSHHRAHHAKNPIYIDVNYGGVLIIFDILFGTFEPESEPEVYGLVHHVASFNPFTTVTHTFHELFQKVCECNTLFKKLLAVIMPPSYIPQTNEWFARVPVDTVKIFKFDPEIPTLNYYYALIHFAFAASISTAILMSTAYTRVQVIVFAFASCLAFGSIGFIFDNEPKREFEYVRLIITLLLSYTFTNKLVAMYWFTCLGSLLVVLKTRK